MSKARGIVLSASPLAVTAVRSSFGRFTARSLSSSIIANEQQQWCTSSIIKSYIQDNTARKYQHQLPNNYNNHQQRRYFARNKRGSPGGGWVFNDDTERVSTPTESKNILVIGSSGVLGKTIVSHFGNKHTWNVIGADVVEPSMSSSKKSSGLAEYINLPKDGSLSDLTGELYNGISSTLQGGESNRNKLDAIVCASGGWAGDVDIAAMMDNHLSEVNNSSELEDVDYEEEYARESAAVCERMLRMNYFPIVAGSQIGHRFMKQGGLFVIIGASAALSPTPGMLGYGSAKAAAHHYLQSWGPSAHEENDMTAVGILPLMIDTPNNRAMLDDGDDENESGSNDRYSKMVKPIHIANEIGEWIKQPHLRPHSGSLVKVIAKNRKDGTGGAAFHLVR